ncbi:MAG TPA: hypothetical protein VHC69_13155 [Polyangiaceae bacterium]|nr:hypothetical protein [Polyangiaceae bacterium]
MKFAAPDGFATANVPAVAPVDWFSYQKHPNPLLLPPVWQDEFPCHAQNVMVLPGLTVMLVLNTGGAVTYSYHAVYAAAPLTF